MEGKAVLFKRFADVDSIDLEVKTEDPNHSDDVTLIRRGLEDDEARRRAQPSERS